MNTHQYVDASERLWQDKVVQLARITGWWVDHTPSMQYSGGRWATGGCKGKPDLELLRPGRNGKAEVIRAELKTLKGELTKQQREYLWMLNAAGIETYVWRPTDWDFIYERLTQKPPE